MLKAQRTLPGARNDARGVGSRRRSLWLPPDGLGALLLVLLLLAACAPTTGSATRPSTALATDAPPPQPSPTAISGISTTVRDTPLPAFTDWRVAYIGADQRVHAVSLDGKTDVTGATTPMPETNATGVWAAGTSRDGKYLAYFASGGSQLTVLDAASGVRTTFIPVAVGDSAILWSPDQRYVALNDTGYVMCVNVADGSRIIAPPLQRSGALPQKLVVSRPFGWLDATHVAVQDVPASSANAVSFQSLDVTTGQLRPIATIQTDENAASFAVEPGGVFTLLSNGRFQDDPFTPAVDLINNATGTVTPLPYLRSLLPASGFTQVLWRPGSSQALVATGFPENGDLKYYLIDVMQDSATPLHLAGFPEAWSPDGGTLVVAAGSQQDMVNELGFNDVGVVGTNPFTLTALTVDSQGHVQNSVKLTTQATTIPMLGFVRTA